jgi:uncharacterized protein YdhG (YjbR/CyaY superfamily)
MWSARTHPIRTATPGTNGRFLYARRMPDSSGDRTRHFPAIEKKHGGPISTWIDRVRGLGDAKYPEQVAFLRENHGFSQAHANALVMYVRGSTTSKRFSSPAEYFASLDPVPARTVREIFAMIQRKHPGWDLVTAWNQPMLRNERGYVFGLSVSSKHILLNPMSSGDVLAQIAPKLKGLDVQKKTVRVPLDWKVSATVLEAMVKARLAELG